MSSDPTCIIDNDLETIKRKFRAAFQVDLCQERGECISCSAKGIVWRSDAGRTEYGLSGVCEDCFDVVTSAVTETSQKCLRCNKLTPVGVGFVQIWIVVRKAAKILRIPNTAEMQRLREFGTSRHDAGRVFLRS